MPVTAISFHGLRDGATVNPLAAACGVGPSGGGNHVDVRRWEELVAIAPSLFRAVELADADLVVYPHAYVDGDETRRVAEAAKERGVPCLFFRSSDDASPASPPYGTVYRDSILASTMTPAERAMPALTNDLLRELGDGLNVRSRSARPDVSFCGYTSNALYRLLYRLQGRQQKALGLTLRHQSLNILEADARVEHRFIRRTQFWGGAVGRRPRLVSLAEQQRAVRDEYIGNIVGSLYTLCLRGAGNFSYRLYEVLCLGRIPLFVDTDCALPFDDAIDWRGHCVWVDQADLPRLADRLVEFHESHDEHELADLQHENRRLWQEWLRPLAFYRHAINRALAGQS